MRLNKILFILFFAFSAGIGSWYYFTEIQTVPIEKIYKHPRDYSNRKIAISGTVTERFSLFVIRYFTVQDATGNILVVTEQPMPAVGEAVRVKGYVEDGFSLGEQQTLVFREARP